MSESDEEIPQLSSHALAALQEFYDEQRQKDEKLNQSLQSADNIKAVEFEENWQLSQFWYDEDTAKALADTAIKAAGENGKIALLSCPTLYPVVKQRCGVTSVKLFEYDKRFSIYGEDFVLYDYKSPLDIPQSLAKEFEVVVADPPFLSEECLTKMAITIKFISKSKIILCTGAVMEELAGRLLGVKKCSITLRHKNNLANEFVCFSNFNIDN